jgi:two-component sensor histidine kinase
MATSCLVVDRPIPTERRFGLPGRACLREARGSTGRLANRINQLEGELAYRDLLLEEIIHRTKNTLQLAVAVLGEEADSARDPWSRRIVRNVQKQVVTLCRSHDRFFGPSGATGRSLSLRVSDLCSSIRDSFGARAGNVTLTVNVAEIPLNRHQELCLSLILQELLVNAFKHAFPCGRPGAVMVDLRAHDPSVGRLVVRDDGVGRARPSESSTGLTLVYGLTAALRGFLALKSDHGTNAELSFQLSEFSESPPPRPASSAKSAAPRRSCGHRSSSNAHVESGV